MILRVFVHPDSTYNFIEIDTEDLDVTCIDSDTGHVILNAPDDLSGCKDYRYSIFISDLINDLIDHN